MINASIVCLVLCLALVIINFYISRLDTLGIQKFLDNATLSALIIFLAATLILWLAVDLTAKPTAKEVYEQLYEAHNRNVHGEKIKRYKLYFWILKIYFCYFSLALIYQCLHGRKTFFFLHIFLLIFSFFLAQTVKILQKKLSNNITLNSYPQLQDLQFKMPFAVIFHRPNYKR